jgi:ubiquinone/menaquinone biosynthesis C-methylase UbiE
MEDNIQNEKIWLLGRSFEEYLKMFALDNEKLAGESFLDCAAGASSFASEMGKKGYRCMAVDMGYGVPVEVMEKRCRNDFKALLDAHSELASKKDWNFFKDSEDMIKKRSDVYMDFLEDYRRFGEERYIPARLPRLPFKNNRFSRVISSNLLFLYDDRLDYDFHLKSIREMLRVASKEIRIFPLVCLRGNGKKSEFVELLCNDLESEFSVEFLKVDYEFREGADELMRIMK